MRRIQLDDGFAKYNGVLYMLNYVTKKNGDERSERGLESKRVDLEASRMLRP